VLIAFTILVFSEVTPKVIGATYPSRWRCCPAES